MTSYKLDLGSKVKILSGRYYLHDLIAQSNYSRIFLATDLALNYRKCAIKQLYPNFCPVKMQPQIESAFLKEVEISRKIAGKHPQVCQFYNYLSDLGNQYLVQEWVEGSTLEQKLRQQAKLSETETKDIFRKILLTLKSIHNLGIVHNDIKPSNIILRLQDNLPVLIDFGIARTVDCNQKPKVIVGTPGYMSVEQAMGNVAFSNDLYSLGLTAIHLLTGISPLDIDFNSSQDNFWQRKKTAFDAKLVAVIDQAISSQPEARFTSASQMLAALDSSPHSGSFSTSLNRKRVKLKLGNLSSIIILVSGIWLYLNHFMPQLDHKPPVDLTNSLTVESLIPPATQDEIKPTVLETTNNALKDVIFVPGTTQNTILEALGEPLWRKPGFWANSLAWSYEDIVAEEFDIGYMFDSRTNTLSQAEIAVPPATDFSTLSTVMASFLASESLTADIEQGLQAIHQRQEKTYSFAIGNLEGVIQRNHQDRIYMAVWSANFH